jgi:hypothetical protein
MKVPKEIQLTRGQVAIVDDEDYERLNQFTWYASFSRFTQSFYAVRAVHISNTGGRQKQRKVSMHQQVMDAPKGMVADHVLSGKTLDNRRSNLRLATPLQNSHNARCRKDSRSGFKGVKIASGRGKGFEARICIKGKMKYLGYSRDPKEAAKLYDEAAVQNFGEFAVTNFPRENYA